MPEIVPIDKAKADFAALLNGRKADLARALPAVGVTPERLLRAVFTAATRQPDLYRCTPQSVYRSVMLAASAGLMPDGITGQAYLLPYNNKGNGLECQLQLGVEGMRVLARRSGEIKAIGQQVVREGDDFSFEYGTTKFLRHVPKPDNRAPIRAFYSVAEFTGGGTDFEVMWKGEVDLVRARSRAKDSGPWVSDYEEMGKKTVTRRLCKRLPKSEEMARLLDADARSSDGLSQHDDVPVPTAVEVKDEAPGAEVRS